MLHFILALLALLALNSGAPTKTFTGIAPFEHNDISSAVNRTSKCLPDLPICGRSIRLPSQGNCGCWGDSKPYAVDHVFVDEAISEACDLFAGGLGEPVSVYGRGGGLLSSFYFNFTYPPTHDGEEGLVRVTFSVKDDAACAGPFPVSYDFCWKMLHYPFDACNQSAEHNKYGGLALDKCLYFVLDPNPGVHLPNDMSG